MKEAIRTGLTLKELILERGLLTKEEIEEILNPIQMTTPGIAGDRLLRPAD
ncbi:hypothetical protein D3C85_1928140 [compost metagenome]